MEGRCPRCNRALVRSIDEYLCLTHGTIVTPVRAWDAAGAEPGLNNVTRRQAATTSARLTARDRAILAGDESAYEHEEATVEDERGFDITSTKALGELCLERVRGLLRDVAKLDSAIAERRTEVRRFLQIAKFCEVPIPAELQRQTGGKPRPEGVVPREAGASRNAWRCPDCGHQTVSRWVQRHKAECAGNAAAS